MMTAGHGDVLCCAVLRAKSYCLRSCSLFFLRRWSGTSGKRYHLATTYKLRSSPCGASLSLECAVQCSQRSREDAGKSKFSFPLSCSFLDSSSTRRRRLTTATTTTLWVSFAALPFCWQLSSLTDRSTLQGLQYVQSKCSLA